MQINWEQLLPVMVSILIIIAIAVLRQYSRTGDRLNRTAHHGDMQDSPWRLEVA